MDVVEARMRDHIHLVRVVTKRREHHWLRAIGLDRSDIEQIALVALWRAAQDYDPEAGMACDVFMLHRMHFAIIDVLRKLGGRDGVRRSRMFPLELVFVPDTEAEIAAYHKGGRSQVRTAIDEFPQLVTSSEAEDVACRNEDCARVRAAIGELPIRWRYVIEARLAGTTVPALARGFQVDESRVLQIQRNARDRMRSWLQAGIPPAYAGAEEATCSSR